MMEKKIFIGTKEIAGYGSRLKYGFKQLGISCDFYDFEKTSFSYGLNDNDKIKYIEKIKNIIYNIYPYTKGINKVISNIKYYYYLISFFIYSLFHYNIFIFLNSSGFLNLKKFDYFILKLFRKFLIFVSLGSDTRPPYMNGSVLNKIKFSVSRCYTITKRKYNDIKIIEKFSDVIINYHPHAQFLTKPFVSGMYIGMPSPKADDYKDIESINDDNVLNKARSDPRKIKILHAPSDPISKGTFIIDDIINRLKDEGYDILYVKLQNMPNSEVISHIRTSDFIINQVYSDSPFSMLSVEAALYKKPSVTSGYYVDYIEKDLDSNLIPATIFVHPDKLYDVCKKLCDSKKLCEENGEKSYNFVKENYTPEIVAKKFLKLIDKNYSSDLFKDPKKIDYFYGYGLPEEKLKEFLRLYIDNYGEKALFLKHNIKLKNDILKFLER
ncbi:MAG: hypothetical protein KBA47_03035 [Caldisericia bacterium]|nr:hypothetical protein [Caldisericia bacterium]